MKEILGNSLFFGVGISVGTYILGTIIKRKVKTAQVSFQLFKSLYGNQKSLGEMFKSNF